MNPFYLLFDARHITLFHLTSLTGLLTTLQKILLVLNFLVSFEIV